MTIFLFLILPVASIALMFEKDTDKSRKTILNVLLALNSLLFLYPLIMAYLNTPKGESLWDENKGGGTALWIYVYILPVTIIAFIVLLILKSVFAPKREEKEKQNDNSNLS